ncbi:MAG: class II glutamine amidotransferase [Clostridiales bacterium]|nr:class II glutamine amidotransferase [Clostridiales bacterium]
MCELFGFSSKNERCINDYLKEFFSHSKRHPHGWGLACFDGKEAFVEKEPVAAIKSNYLKERLTQPVYVKAAFAHIRYATIGNVAYKNCHPFTGKDSGGRRWTLVHNGTIFDYSPLDEFVRVQVGDTDSERVFLYLMKLIREKEEKLHRPLTAQERFELLDEMVVHMSRGNKLNLLIYDGEWMYVHTNYANSLYSLEQSDSVFFSTVPLTRDDWKPVPFTTLLAYQDGKLLKKGTNHGQEYIDCDENEKFLYQIFSDL